MRLKPPMSPHQTESPIGLTPDADRLEKAEPVDILGQSGDVAHANSDGVGQPGRFQRRPPWCRKCQTAEHHSEGQHRDGDECGDAPNDNSDCAGRRQSEDEHDHAQEDQQEDSWHHPPSIDDRHPPESARSNTQHADDRPERNVGGGDDPEAVGSEAASSIPPGVPEAPEGCGHHRRPPEPPRGFQRQAHVGISPRRNVTHAVSTRSNGRLGSFNSLPGQARPLSPPERHGPIGPFLGTRSGHRRSLCTLARRLRVRRSARNALIEPEPLAGHSATPSLRADHRSAGQPNPSSGEPFMKPRTAIAAIAAIGTIAVGTGIGVNLAGASSTGTASAFVPIVPAASSTHARRTTSASATGRSTPARRSRSTSSAPTGTATSPAERPASPATSR